MEWIALVQRFISSWCMRVGSPRMVASAHSSTKATSIASGVEPRTRSTTSCAIGATITGNFSAPSARLYERICVTSALARLPAPMMVSM